MNQKERENKDREESEKQIIADLHIHSRFSRACSRDLTVSNLVKWARIKGINLLGTGDFQHPEWFKELNELEEREGVAYYRDSEGKFPFLWQTEVSLIYSKNGKGRRIHYVILAPDKEVVKQITKFLGSRGRLDYDGRPIFGFSSVELAESMEKIDDKIEIIPAHAWTPWFGIFGSNSGYDSLKEAFEEKSNRIHAIETGISSDPEMNWKIKDLDDKSIVSFSDLHSYWPWRLGREATIFNLYEEELSYDLILRQIRENSFIGTVETDPAYGKYHFDGHANCGFSCSFEETKKLNGICPKCGKSLIIGVDYRTHELSKKGDANPKVKKPFYRLLPLHEIISLGLGIGINSKGCWKVYNELIDRFGNEFNVLLNVGKVELANAVKNELLVELIMRNREGKIKVKPGYDGQYGVALWDNKVEKQKKLF